MKPEKIGIIGNRGCYGSYLDRLFRHLGYGVVGSDVDTSTRNEDVVEWSDVVIFSTPIHSTVDIIKSLLALSRPSQLWMDLTTIKVPAIGAMLQSKAEVAGLHPLFSPPENFSWRGKRIVVCHSRLSKWCQWLDQFLNTMEAGVRIIGPEEHDSIMAIEQNLTHLGIFMTASVIRELGVSPNDLFVFSTPVSRLLYANIGRVLSQDSGLYTDIQMCHPSSLKMIDACINTLRRFRDMVALGENQSFNNEFRHNRKYLGKTFLDDSSSIFNTCMRACEEKK